MSRQGLNRNGVQGLHVFVRRQGQQNFERIQPQTDLAPLGGIVRTVIDRAFLLLESGRGWTGLQRIANDIVVERLEARETCLFPDRHFPSLGVAVDHFLRTMRAGFPNIFLRRTDGEAATIRYVVRPAFPSLLDFEPLRAGELWIQYQYIYNMTQTRNNAWFSTWIFRMALTIAHELAHFLTGYLNGTSRPLTPDGVSVPGWQGEEGGEAGRAWELATFGGIVEFWSVGNDVLQPGEPIIFPDLLPNTPGTPVSMNYVEDFARGVVRLPIRPSTRAQPITRQQLRDSRRREMNTLRGTRGTGEAPGAPVQRAGPGAPYGGTGSSSSVRHRVPPPQPPPRDFYYR